MDTTLPGWFLAGATLGVAGGLSPGPLTVLVLTQTLRFGLKEGARVAIAPILTDGPLIVLSSVLVGAVAGIGPALSILSLAGALVLLWLAWQTAKVDEIPLPDAPAASPRSVRTAVLTNLFNPHPYLFWLTIGGPMVATAWDRSPAAAGLWAGGFFAGLCGSKLVLAAVVDRVRHRIGGGLFRWVMRALAAALVLLAAGFLHEAWISAPDGVRTMFGTAP